MPRLLLQCTLLLLLHGGRSLAAAATSVLQATKEWLSTQELSRMQVASHAQPDTAGHLPLAGQRCTHNAPRATQQCHKRCHAEIKRATTSAGPQLAHTPVQRPFHRCRAGNQPRLPGNSVRVDCTAGSASRIYSSSAAEAKSVTPYHCC